MYEPNNNCAEAKGITTDGVTQLHTFGQQTDEDWVAFKTQAGEHYQIEVQVAPDSLADVGVELWGNCTGAQTKAKITTLRLAFASYSRLLPRNSSTLKYKIKRREFMEQMWPII